ncbi:hypothetical protein [Aeromonas taiwanensis]|uniref:hypothetical protein n=1 Tax=Aeromonas taiwanensis TaxID=633417 RepID=UPI003B9ED4FC
MHIAFNAKLNSGCLSRQVGAVVTDAELSIKSIGWNNVAQGQTPCNLRRVEDLINNEDESAFSLFEKNNTTFKERIGEIYSFKPGKSIPFGGKPVSFCFKDIKNSIDGEKIKSTQGLCMQKKMPFCKFQNMEGCQLRADGYTQQQAHVNSVQKKHAN